MSRNIKADFFQVGFSDDRNPRFEEIIERVARIAAPKRYTIIGSNPVRLHEVGRWGDRWEGELMRIRMDVTPLRANLSGAVIPLDLDEDEGLGEETAFLFDPHTQVLVLQRNRLGVSASAAALYFQSQAGLYETLFLRPVLRRDAVARLENLREVRRLDVRFAGISNPAALRTDGSVSEMIDVLNEFRAPSANITLSMGHRKGSLNLEAVKRFVQRISGISAENEQPVRKLEIAGTGADEERDVFDLINYSLVEQRNLEPDSGRNVSYNRRRAFLRDAFERHREWLSTMFSA